MAIAKCPKDIRKLLGKRTPNLKSGEISIKRQFYSAEEQKQ